MNGEPGDPHLVGPVTATSLIQRRPGVLYTEARGLSMLYDPVGRLCHALSAPAVALWVALDGRPLSDALEAVFPPPDGVSAASQERLAEAIDLVRRLRAMGLVEDAGAGPAPPVSGDAADLSPQQSIAFAGMTKPSGEGVIVSVVDPRDRSPGPDADSAIVVIDLDRIPTSGGDPLVGIESPRATDAPVLLPGGLPPQEALSALVRALAEPDELTPELLDALAGLIEVVPVVPAGNGDRIDAGSVSR